MDTAKYHQPAWDPAQYAAIPLRSIYSTSDIVTARVMLHDVVTFRIENLIRFDE
jgi:hypothetical protein